MENKEKFNALRSHMQVKSIDDELMQFSEFESRGNYRDIQIELNAILKGDVNARNIKCNGETAINGKITCESLTINGLSKLNGDITCNKLELHGEVDIVGAVECSCFNCDGKTKINDDIRAKELILNGSCDNKKNIISQSIKGKGGVIAKVIEANVIELNITKKSIVDNIKGNDIKIIAPKAGLISKLMAKGYNLEVDKIEGDKIVIENIKVKEIIGRDITIGENTIVDKVYYKETIKIDKTAKVANEEKR